MVPVQTVDATPSGIKLFSKVVFMKQRRRFGFSAEQKLDVDGSIKLARSRPSSFQSLTSTSS
jgi:hypothetical protein